MMDNYDDIINDCNDIDRQNKCEYCGGKVRHVVGGYKDDEAVAVCNDCGMVDPR